MTSLLFWTTLRKIKRIRQQAATNLNQLSPWNAPWIPNMSNASTEMKIKGMTCSHCKRAVEQAISKVQGVDRVDVDLQLGAVEEEGYSAQIVPVSKQS
jgi:copper chaperone CopZ